MKPRLVVRDEDLDIRPLPQKRVPSPEAIERTLSQPAWWSGAADARAALYATDESLLTGRGIVRAQMIGAALIAGLPLADIDPYHEWLRPGLVR